MPDEGKVSLSFEYLFGNLQQTLESGFNRLDKSIDEVRRQLDTKASNESVAELKRDLANHQIHMEKQLAKVDERFKPLEYESASDAGVSKWKVYAGNAMVALASSSVGAFLYYIIQLGSHK